MDREFEYDPDDERPVLTDEDDPHAAVPTLDPEERVEVDPDDETVDELIAAERETGRA